MPDWLVEPAAAWPPSVCRKGCAGPARSRTRESTRGPEHRTLLLLPDVMTPVNASDTLFETASERREEICADVPGMHRAVNFRIVDIVRVQQYTPVASI